MKRLAYLFLLVTLIGGLSACSSPDVEDVNTETKNFPFPRLSPSAPPTAPFEPKPHATNPMQEVWRAGYWSYDGSQFVWIPGTYMVRPEPTAVWIPDRWEHRTFGWAFIPGHWR